MDTGSVSGTGDTKWIRNTVGFQGGHGWSETCKQKKMFFCIFYNRGIFFIQSLIHWKPFMLCPHLLSRNKKRSVLKELMFLKMSFKTDILKMSVMKHSRCYEEWVTALQPEEA